MDDLQQLEQWAAPLLERLQPGARRALARELGVILRRSQQQRIAQQRNPDGSAYAPRKREKRLRDKAGRIKRGAMFEKIRLPKHLRVHTDASGVWVGFTGRVARIARVHQEGDRDYVNSQGLMVLYERRRLLGFSTADREMIRERLIEHLTAT